MIRLEALRFYCRLAIFAIHEEYSSLSTTLAGLVLYPAFVWIFAKLWLGLNASISTFTPDELFAYIGLTELLFMTSLREAFIDRANADFALSFTRPRSWTGCICTSIYSRTLFRRGIYLVIYAAMAPLFTNNLELIPTTILRFVCFLPLLTALETLYSLLLTCVQIRHHSIKTFRMLFGKFFLIFGGTLAPLSDIPLPWKTLFINTPFADLIFQPCYFAIHGTFFTLAPITWSLRILGQMTLLALLVATTYRQSRKYYHNFGG